MNLILTSIVFFGNFWIWKIFKMDPVIGIVVSLTTLALSYHLRRNKIKFSKILLVFFALLLFLQWKSTDIRSLTNISNDQKRIQDMRLKEYPPVKITLFNKTIWVPIAYWFEGRRETIAFFRILDNFSEVVDPNLYFFANHPRERIGITEFEKFPYIFLPFFIYGLFSLLDNKKGKFILFASIPQLILISIIGSDNPLGSFSLSPFIAVATSRGLSTAYAKLKKNSFKRMSLILVTFIFVFVLVLIQMYSYEKF